MFESADDRPPEKGKAGTRVSPRLIGALVLLVLLVVFIAQNRDKHDVQFVFFSANVGTWFLILVSILLGMVLGALLYARRERAKRRQV